MLTYVINTSENKTFDSDQLFNLVGYNKIRWLNCKFKDIGKCAKGIAENQNNLGADDFRVAIIVDFFGFDKIRSPYGKFGYNIDEGVDLSLYVPFMEAYVIDNFVKVLNSEELSASDLEMYYIHNGKYDKFDILENAEKQITQVLTPVEETVKDIDEDRLARLDMCWENVETAKKKYESGKKNAVEVKKAYKSIDLMEGIDSVVLDQELKDYLFSEGKYKKDPKNYPFVDENIVLDQKIVETLTKKFSKDKESGSKKIDLLHNNYQRVLDAKAKYDENVKKKDALKQESQVTNEKIDADRAVISQSIITIMKRLEIYQEDEEKSPYVVNNVVFTEVEYGIIRNYLLPYSEFRLYCTNTESLIFKTSDYPYGSDRFNIHDFYVACRMRFAEYTRIRAHHFATNHSSSKEKAAFDALSLSLFLIRTYEREETVPDDDVDIPKIDPITFKNMLVNSWNKVNLARDKALENNSKYFDLTYFEDGPESMAQQYEEKRTIDQDIAEMKRTVYLNDFEKDVEFQYSHITNIALHKDVDMIRQDDSDIDSAMSKYLLKRDITKEADVQSESIIKKKDWTKFTEKCPSQTDYELLVRKKEEKISKCLGKSLSVEFATIDYDEEKKQADKIYDDYKRTEKSMGKSLVGDVVFLILAVLAMLIPYALLQRSAEGAFTAESWLLYLLTGGVFAGLFIIVLLARVIPIANKLRLLKFQMQKVYETVIAKQRLASGELTERYANDLIVVEEERYRIRQITYFHNLNLEKEKHIAKHRELLEIVENYISGMLNNLGVVPQKNYNIRIEGEFNIDKPIYSNENKIYKIFSLEAIEDLYPKKGE